MNWIERESFDHIENLHNMDRARGFSAPVLVVELLLIFLLGTKVMLPGSPSANDRESAGGAGMVRLEPLFVWPVTKEVAQSTEPVSVTKQAAEKESLPGNLLAKDPTSTAVVAGNNVVEPDDIRIVSITPSRSVPLWVGDNTEFSVEVEYTLNSASTGQVTLKICACTSNPSPVPIHLGDSEREIRVVQVGVPGGSHRRLTIKTDRLRIPLADEIIAGVTLVRNGQSEQAPESAFYAVRDKISPPSSNQNQVRVTRTRPTTDKALPAGEEVEVDVWVSSNLLLDIGTVALKFEAGDVELLPPFSETIWKGERTLQFPVKLRIPERGALHADKLTITIQIQEAGGMILDTRSLNYPISGL
jgi:hypothetical protein